MSTTYGTHLRRWLLSLPPVELLVGQLRDLLINSLKCGPIPRHVAFVMDGNRRYARARNLETVEGHNLGFEALARILEVCYKSGVEVVTIYAFSIENFKRSRYEVDALMDMAKTKLIQMAQHGEIFDRYGAQLRVLGDRSLLREDVLKRVDQAVNMTAHNNKAVLNVCFPYTGREEITHAVRETVREVNAPLSRPPNKTMFSESHIQHNIILGSYTTTPDTEPDLLDATGLSTPSLTVSDEDSSDAPDLDSSSHHPTSSASSLSSSSPPPHTLSKPKSLPSPDSINEDVVSSHLYTHPAPPLDLLVRTSGVQRLSDFMLWQCHQNTEIRFLDCLWPEFDLWRFIPVLLEWQYNQKRAERVQTPQKHIIHQSVKTLKQQ